MYASVCRVPHIHFHTHAPPHVHVCIHPYPAPLFSGECNLPPAAQKQQCERNVNRPLVHAVPYCRRMTSRATRRLHYRKLPYDVVPATLGCCSAASSGETAADEGSPCDSPSAPLPAGERFAFACPPAFDDCTAAKWFSPLAHVKIGMNAARAHPHMHVRMCSAAHAIRFAVSTAPRRARAAETRPIS